MLVLASFLIFLVPLLSGTDPSEVILRARIGERELTQETVEQFRHELGLDRPLTLQYVSWLGRLLRGDLGVSYVSRVPVGGILWRGFKITAVLASLSVSLAFAIAIPLGVLAAVNSGRWLDNLISGATQTGVAVPEYWLAPVLVLVFALYLGWLPSAGWRGPLHVILPTLTLALRPIAYFTRLTRTAIIEVLHKDYIRAARARGLTEFQTFWRHALRNSLIPVVTYAAIWLTSLLGGAVIVEVIFAVPGIGRVLYQAVQTTDLPLLQAGLMVLVGLTVVIYTLTDLVYIALNPAISLEKPH
jgi:peptide/nickel transport system permease protein